MYHVPIVYTSDMSIELRNAAFSYFLPDGTEIPALKPTSLSLGPREFVAVVGANGSGKSTLGKLLNGLLVPTIGEVIVNGRSTDEPMNLLPVRRTVGMVFQNPDNQLVATVVEDDVAFGPENLGVPTEEIRERVDQALKQVGLAHWPRRDPHHLSAGQRQKVAIAGVLAMRPLYMVLDEPTSMLDPLGRREVLATLAELRSGEPIGIVYITHVVEEAAEADRVIVLREGLVLADGPPRDVLSDERLMSDASLYATKASRIAHRLAENNVPLSKSLLTVEEVAGAICSLT
jgi:energy-coupling factor transport system ATP-binding protein